MRSRVAPPGILSAVSRPPASPEDPAPDASPVVSALAAMLGVVIGAGGAAWIGLQFLHGMQSAAPASLGAPAVPLSVMVVPIALPLVTALAAYGLARWLGVGAWWIACGVAAPLTLGSAALLTYTPCAGLGAFVGLVLPAFAASTGVGRMGLRRRAADRAAHNACPSCGYMLTGVESDVCPECGERIREAARPEGMGEGRRETEDGSWETGDRGLGQEEERGTSEG